MQLLGNFGTFYVILSECVGAMPMVPPPSLHMTHVPHDEAKSSSLSIHATTTIFLGAYRYRRFIVDLSSLSFGPQIDEISSIYRRYIDDISTIYVDILNVTFLLSREASVRARGAHALRAAI